MQRIAREAKLSDMLTKFDYRIYGLKNDNQNEILITNWYRNIWNSTSVLEFFRKQGFACNLVNGGKAATITIGIRRDIRDNASLCAAIIQTIIYTAEGRMNLSGNFKLNIKKNKGREEVSSFKSPTIKQKLEGLKRFRKEAAQTSEINWEWSPYSAVDPEE